MKRLSLCFVILCSLISCSNSGFVERKIGERVENCKPYTDCIIKISEITDFEWDKMYVFHYGLSPEDLRDILGTDPPDYEEFKRWMVFLKDGKVVYKEIEPTDIEGMVDGQVTFSDTEDTRYCSFTPETAVFSAGRYISGGGVFYGLQRLK